MDRVCARGDHAGLADYLLLVSAAIRVHACDKAALCALLLMPLFLHINAQAL